MAAAVVAMQKIERGMRFARRLPIAAVLATLALAGCVSEQTTLSGPEAEALVAAIATSDIGPGPERADGISASMLFSQVCNDTAPSFRKAPAVMAKMPFRQHPGTGTYYHQKLDLSIKLMPKRCSMVFSSSDDPTALGIMMSASVTKPTNGNASIGLDADTGAASTAAAGGTLLDFEPMGRSNGRNYYRAVLIAP